MTRTYAVELTIPDNEAFTAQQTLVRLGVPVARVRRADIWRFEVDTREAAALTERVAAVETIHNPNKHRLIERAADRPDAGEVWIVVRDERPATAVGGRTIPGVEAIRRATAWRLLDERGHALGADETRRAVAAFLCNPASQEAIEPPTW